MSRHDITTREAPAGATLRAAPEPPPGAYPEPDDVGTLAIWDPAPTSSGFFDSRNASVHILLSYPRRQPRGTLYLSVGRVSYLTTRDEGETRRYREEALDLARRMVRDAVAAQDLGAMGDRTPTLVTPERLTRANARPLAGRSLR